MAPEGTNLLRLMSTNQNYPNYNLLVLINSNDGTETPPTPKLMQGHDTRYNNYLENHVTAQTPC